MIITSQINETNSIQGLLFQLKIRAIRTILAINSKCRFRAHLFAYNFYAIHATAMIFSLQQDFCMFFYFDRLGRCRSHLIRDNRLGTSKTGKTWRHNQSSG